MPKEPYATPPPPVPPPVPTNQEQLVALSVRIGEILAEFGGLESNIPVSGHEYWQVKAQINALRNAIAG